MIITNEKQAKETLNQLQSDLLEMSVEDARAKMAESGPDIFQSAMLAGRTEEFEDLIHFLTPDETWQFYQNALAKYPDLHKDAITRSHDYRFGIGLTESSLKIFDVLLKKFQNDEDKGHRDEIVKSLETELRVPKNPQNFDHSSIDNYPLEKVSLVQTAMRYNRENLRQAIYETLPPTEAKALRVSLFCEVAKESDHYNSTISDECRKNLCRDFSHDELYEISKITRDYRTANLFGYTYEGLIYEAATPEQIEEIAKHKKLVFNTTGLHSNPHTNWIHRLYYSKSLILTAIEIGNEPSSKLERQLNYITFTKSPEVAQTILESIDREEIRRNPNILLPVLQGFNFARHDRIFEIVEEVASKEASTKLLNDFILSLSSLNFHYKDHVLSVLGKNGQLKTFSAINNSGEILDKSYQLNSWQSTSPAHLNILDIIFDNISEIPSQKLHSNLLSLMHANFENFCHVLSKIPDQQFSLILNDYNFDIVSYDRPKIYNVTQETKIRGFAVIFDKMNDQDKLKFLSQRLKPEPHPHKTPGDKSHLNDAVKMREANLRIAIYAAYTLQPLTPEFAEIFDGFKTSLTKREKILFDGMSNHLQRLEAEYTEFCKVKNPALKTEDAKKLANEDVRKQMVEYFINPQHYRESLRTSLKMTLGTEVAHRHMLEGERNGPMLSQDMMLELAHKWLEGTPDLLIQKSITATIPSKSVANPTSEKAVTKLAEQTRS